MIIDATIIDGKAIAAEIRKEIKIEIQKLGIIPSLRVITIGNDPASQVYVNKKIEACEEVGIKASQIFATSYTLLKQIEFLNEDNKVHAYILQLPLPKEMNPLNYFSKFNPLKDVDVFHPENVGLLVQGRPRFKPCTPHGIQIMLNRSGIKVAGKNVVVINRSNVVGKPLSSMLIQECPEYANATVTVCHDHTPPNLLKSLCLEADIVIVAVGKPGFLTADMVNSNQIVVDVGINRIYTTEGKMKIVGDVADGVKDIVKAISPVPGGVGPLTVACLLKNTLKACQMQMGLNG